MTTPPRIGLYGGTFDPVHHGHLILARDAVERLALDQMIFVPAAINPHKLTRHPTAPGALRLSMLEAAVMGEPYFAVDDGELRRAGPSYSIDTVLAIRQRFPEAELLYFIGADNLPALDTWHRIGELRKLVQFTVFPRSGEVVGENGEAARRLDISATEIRNRVAAGLSIRYLVPEAVAALIATHRLYRFHDHPQPATGAEPSPPKN